jgi:predicted nucleic acid-binding protein
MKLTGFSFWNSLMLVLASAEVASAEVLCSEDMHHAQQAAGLTIRDSFAD